MALFAFIQTLETAMGRKRTIKIDKPNTLRIMQAAGLPIPHPTLPTE